MCFNTNKQTLCLCKKLGTVSCFNPGNLQRSINSPKKDTSYNCRYCLVFVPHQSAPYYWRLVSSVKALDGLRLFIKTSETENHVRSRTVDVPRFFHVLELARRCSHGSVVKENADPLICDVLLCCPCNCEKLKMKLIFYYIIQAILL